MRYLYFLKAGCSPGEKCKARMKNRLVFTDYKVLIISQPILSRRSSWN